jgi:hypothetical protein
MTLAGWEGLRRRPRMDIFFFFFFLLLFVHRTPSPQPPKPPSKQSTPCVEDFILIPYNLGAGASAFYPYFLPPSMTYRLTAFRLSVFLFWDRLDVYRDVFFCFVFLRTLASAGAARNRLARNERALTAWRRPDGGLGRPRRRTLRGQTGGLSQGDRHMVRSCALSAEGLWYPTRNPVEGRPQCFRHGLRKDLLETAR